MSNYSDIAQGKLLVDMIVMVLYGRSMTLGFILSHVAQRMNE
jgi:hypothetical protein